MSINNADQSIILRPPKEYKIKEIRFELDGVDPDVLKQTAASNGLTVEAYLQSIAQKILRHPNMAEVLRIAKAHQQKNEGM
ncbi:MAG: hypothetical protein KBD00_01280 [Candidatus Peribacteraceae bacterium]|nr:hypothetical protein [Candidatus Peribacteraceae bacterium]